MTMRQSHWLTLKINHAFTHIIPSGLRLNRLSFQWSPYFPVSAVLISRFFRSWVEASCEPPSQFQQIFPAIWVLFQDHWELGPHWFSKAPTFYIIYTVYICLFSSVSVKFPNYFWYIIHAFKLNLFKASCAITPAIHFWTFPDWVEKLGDFPRSTPSGIGKPGGLLS